MVQKSHALHKRTPTTETISFNPYRNPTHSPSHNDGTTQDRPEMVSSEEFNTRIGLGAGLSAFILAVIALFVYFCYRRSRRRRLRQEVGAERMTQRHGTPRVVAGTPRPEIPRIVVDTPRTAEDREMSNVTADADDDGEARPKQPFVRTHVDGHERGESSSRGGDMQSESESMSEHRANPDGTQAFQNFRQGQP